MDKFRQFFLRINLLTEEQFNQLAKCVDISITLPTNKLGGNERTTLKFIYKQPIPIDLFSTLYNNIKSKSDMPRISFIGESIPISIDIFYDYVNWYLQRKNLTSSFTTDLINRKTCSIDDNGNVNFLYVNIVEAETFKKIEKDLIVFFKFLNFKVVSFSYDVDKAHRDVEKAKEIKLKQIEEEIKKSLSSTSKFKSISEYSANYIKNYKRAQEYELSNIEEPSDEKGYFAKISGEIFKLEVPEPNSDKRIYKFYITDHKDAIAIKINKKFGDYDRANLSDEYLSWFDIGEWVSALVKIVSNKYTNNQPEGQIYAIAKKETPKEFVRNDLTNKPRIELLAHTNMSTLDGIISPQKLIKRSKKYGSPAIGVADRFNVHAFPDIFKYANECKQKVCYGVECNIIPNKFEIVKNSRLQNFNQGKYVIFDIETTGLNNEFDEITEFGAIKVENDIVVDKVDWFVSITKPLSEKIKQKTHITDEMLKDQPSIKIILKKIIDFFDDAVIIAHNAFNFDIRFINKKLQQNGMEPIKNPIIDTLILSYALNTDMKRHNLGALARDAKVPYDDITAHRADFDAEVLFRVWQYMAYKMIKLGFNNIDEINTKLQNQTLHHNQFGHFIVIYAKNQAGIKDIYRLVSTSHTINWHKRPRIYYHELEKCSQNLVIANHPTESDLWDIAINGNDEQLVQIMNFYDYIFIAPPANVKHLIERGEMSEINVKKIIKKIIETATNLNKKVIAVSDAYYLDPVDKIGQTVYINAKQTNNRSLHRLYRHDERNDINTLPDMHLRTTDEMYKELSFIDEITLQKIIIDNAYEFVECIQSDIKPVVTKAYRPKIENVDENLSEVVNKRAKQLYGDNIPKEIADRISHELNMIISNQYSSIYWICHKLIEQTNRDGHIVGSRGSVGSSIVAYLTNITEVNPLKPHYYCPACKKVIFSDKARNGFDLPPKECPECGKLMRGDGHDIPFETFLGFANKPKEPDIDLNFSGDYQPIAHEFIKKMFGDKHTYRIGTVLKNADKKAGAFVKDYYANETLRHSFIEWIATKCAGTKITTGQHAGGIIVIPKENDILDFTPYAYQSQETPDVITTHFEKDAFKEFLLKFDILGHDEPKLIKMLEEITGVKQDEIPFQDEAVMKLFSSVESLKIRPSDILGAEVGTFYIPEMGTDFVMNILSIVKPSTFADLVSISGLTHGTEVWQKNAEVLIKENHYKISEVISCRDDVMQYLITKGIDNTIAFYIMEAVRKGKGLTPDQQKLLKNEGVPDWYIDSCKKIKYLFPKAHAVAYVMAGWRMAWYKIHYPIAFYAATFSIRSKDFDLETILKGPEAVKDKVREYKSKGFNIKKKEKDLIPVFLLVLEMYARGFSIKNIDLNKSAANTYLIDGKSLIPPFSSLDGVGDSAQSIVDARKEKPFSSKDDLLNRTKISKTILKKFDELGITNGLNDDDDLSLFSYFS